MMKSDPEDLGRPAASYDGPPLHQGLHEVAEHYDAFVCDLWGVLHDGVRAFPAAVACLREFRQRSKRILVLSNAPRRASEVESRMNELGIGPALYDHVLSSGEIAWRHLKQRPDAFYRSLGDRCFHLGPDRDNGMREGLDLTFVERIADADFVLNTGAHMPEDTVETYGHELEEAAGRHLPMVCANPDLEVIRGGRREICAGKLAERYEALGGRVRYHGKPHPDVYEVCLAQLGGIDPSRVAAIGDSLRTDIAGAEAAGIDGLLILGGIHAEALGLDEQGRPAPGRLAGLCVNYGTRPTGAFPFMVW